MLTPSVLIGARVSVCGQWGLMQVLPWATVVILVAVLAFVRSLWKIGIRDRHHLAQFTFLLMLEPSVYAAQRDNFVRLVRKLKAGDSSDLGSTLLLELSRHAHRVTEGLTEPISERMWQINQGASDIPTAGEFLGVPQETDCRET